MCTEDSENMNESKDENSAGSETDAECANESENVNANIEEKLNSLETMFKKRLLYDEGKEKIIDKLHAELQDYKQDLYFQLTRPIFFDIVFEIDEIRKMKKSADADNADEINPQLDSIAQSFTYLLDKYEVLPYSSEINTKFDAVRQRAVGTVATEDDALVGLISESVFAGFEHKGRIISPEKVKVYKKQIVEGK